MNLNCAWEIQNSHLISSSILIQKSLLHKQQIQQLPKMAKTTKLAQPKHTQTTVHVRTGISRTTTFTIPMPPRGTIFLFRYRMGEVNLLTTSSTCVHVGARAWWATWEVHVSAPLDCPIVFDRRLRDLCTVLMHRSLSQGSFLYV